MAGPEVSVILTSFNRAALLPRAIESVLAQTGCEFELIVVDDASSDATPAYLATLRDPRVRIHIAQRNLGPSEARNVGLELAAAPVVTFLDCDDLYLPGRLSVPLKALTENADVVCTLSSARKFDRAVPRDALVPALKLTMQAFEWALLCDLVPVEATSITARRDAAIAAGGFCGRLRLTEDREFLIRLAKQGGCQLIGEILWEKSWSDDGLSMDSSHIADGLIAYTRERPEYVSRFGKLGSYLATKVLISHLRDRRYGLLWPDFQKLRAAGLISGNPIRDIRDHLDVKHYRRAMNTPDALALLKGPPDTWR